RAPGMLRAFAHRSGEPDNSKARARPRGEPTTRGGLMAGSAGPSPCHIRRLEGGRRRPGEPARRPGGRGAASAFTGLRRRCSTGMKSYTEHGALMLADISGFTEFVTTTAIEHGPLIIAELLKQVIEQISPPLEIQEIEGDAVFAL